MSSNKPSVEHGVMASMEVAWLRIMTIGSRRLTRTRTRRIKKKGPSDSSNEAGLVSCFPMGLVVAPVYERSLQIG
eukprot:13582247-Ditylum_brightwellii.AAC.1